MSKRHSSYIEVPARDDRGCFGFFIILLVAIAAAIVMCMFPGCTTVRPLTVKEVAQAKQLHDTLVLRQELINNPVKIVEVPSKKDTIYLVTETRIETKIPYLDSAQLAPYLEENISRLVTQVSALQNTVAFLLTQHKIGSDSVRIIQAKFDTTVKQAKADKEYVAASKKLFFDGPLYIICGYLIIAAIIFLCSRYIKRRFLRKKSAISKTP